ncbi:SDR family NAD(P)-dependent oxidoreductase [Agrobacterium sp. LAD9]|uniref:SDR family NAD(P)-dependent oxidoreductase n=1 Tax=Agrobacterium sp. LAD9 TaxID=2055153 RepID=UPI000D1D67C2|nr:SDR family NAD(P)-dependent oxidoreductase [Agrobacterium sp. LAD9]
MTNQIDLQGRVAVITGGASGIGLETALRFGQSGATVVLWDIDADQLAAALERNPDFAIHRVDVNDEASVENAATETAGSFGRIDILVNSAGIGNVRHTVAGYPLDSWRRIIDINLTGTFLCCRAVVPIMQRTNYGRIVNISSVAGKEGPQFASAYAAAKAGVIALTKSLAKELIKTDIRVNTITPAAVETELFRKMSPESQAASRSRIPLGRLGQPAEIAAMIAWLASEECSFSTGAVFDLSGGKATY